MPSKKKNKNRKKKQAPFVSICTPTFNRRPFFTQCFECLRSQTYPHSRLEWLIYDDGTDPVKDLIDAFAETTSIRVRYFRSEKHLPLSEKRNFLNDRADGSFLCYWDDDDYYQPGRIAYSVKQLQANPDCLVAGGSAMYCYFNDTQEIWKFGPYGMNHTTAAVMFFRKDLLKQTRFEKQAFLAEEKAFLKNYTFPMVQLHPSQTIVIVAHSQNSVDKRSLIANGETRFVKKTKLTLDHLIKDHAARYFITDQLEPALATYTAGDVRNKPDVLLAMLNNLKARFNNLRRQYVELANAHNMLVQRQHLASLAAPPSPNTSTSEPPPPLLSQPAPQSTSQLRSASKQRTPMKRPAFLPDA
jgi:glycosyltransferase involved in cell wall biosynthesis